MGSEMCIRDRTCLGDLAKYFKFASKRSKNKLASKNAMTPDKTYLGEGGG